MATLPKADGPADSDGLSAKTRGDALPTVASKLLSICASGERSTVGESVMFNDGILPDDVKFTMFAESASMEHLALVAKTNRNARRMVPYAIDMRFLALLRYYFTDEGGMLVRDFMRANGVFIAGSEGHRLARGHRAPTEPEEKIKVWEPNNIDFYTSEGVSEGLVALIVSLGASYVHPEGVAAVADNNNHARRKATKSITHLTLRGKIIVVHESTGRRAATAALDSWTTSCMAMVTADFVVVFYPAYFFNDIAILQGLEETFAGTEHLVDKYKERGVTHVEPCCAPVKSYCLADWATIVEPRKVCVLPMSARLWGTVPDEFAGRFRWRATIHCYDPRCAVHQRAPRPKSLIEELGKLIKPS